MDIYVIKNVCIILLIILNIVLLNVLEVIHIMLMKKENNVYKIVVNKKYWNILKKLNVWNNVMINLHILLIVKIILVVNIVHLNYKKIKNIVYLQHNNAHNICIY